MIAFTLPILFQRNPNNNNNNEILINHEPLVYTRARRAVQKKKKRKKKEKKKCGGRHNTLHYDCVHFTHPVSKEPKCGGTRCEYEQDQRDCTGACCPVDCVEGPWSAWSVCPATCGTSTVTRTRFVQRAECGGVECEDNTEQESKECEQYNNVDCKVSGG